MQSKSIVSAGAQSYLIAGQCSPLITAFGATHELAFANDHLPLSAPSQAHLALLRSHRQHSVTCSLACCFHEHCIPALTHQVLLGRSIAHSFAFRGCCTFIQALMHQVMLPHSIMHSFAFHRHCTLVRALTYQILLLHSIMHSSASYGLP